MTASGIFGNDERPPAKCGLRSKAEGPANEVYRTEDGLRMLLAAWGR